MTAVTKPTEQQQPSQHKIITEFYERYEAAVEQCESVRRNAMNDASAFAINQPMFGQQVADELRRVMAMLPKVSFDEETGRVIVADQT